MSELGRPLADGEVIRRQPAVSLDLLIRRRSLLYVAPDFLGYMLAIGLCCMTLLITHSQDQIIPAVGNQRGAISSTSLGSCLSQPWRASSAICS